MVGGLWSFARQQWKRLAGVILVGLSWKAREIESLYPVILVVAGLVLLVGADLLDRIKKAKFSSNGNSVEVELDTETKRERDASAEAADTRITASSFSARIQSDDDGPPDPTDDDPAVIGALNYAAGAIALEAIRNEATSDTASALNGCEVRIYVYDDDLQALAPVFHDRNRGVATTWPPGVGATGWAFATGSYVLAEGNEVRNEAFGLTAEQGKRFEHLSAVASSPMFTSGGEILGVITASTSVENPPLATDEGYVALTATGLLCSRVMIELLQWFNDYG